MSYDHGIALPGGLLSPAKETVDARTLHEPVRFFECLPS